MTGTQRFWALLILVGVIAGIVLRIVTDALA